MADEVKANSSTAKPRETQAGGYHVATGAMSFEQWSDLGRMGKAFSAADVAFDRDLREHSEENLADRAEIEREPQAHEKIFYNHPLANPVSERDFTPFEAGHSLWAHYQRTLLTRDHKALDLFLELARTGNKLVQEAANLKADRRGRGRSAEDVKNALLDANHASSVDHANEIAEEVESLSQSEVSGAFGGGDFTIVASSESEARVIRGMIDFALSKFPPATGFNDQKLPLKIEDLPPADEIKKALDACRPPLFDPQAREDGKKAVALIHSYGLHEVLADHVAKLSKDIAVYPGMSSQLRSTLMNRKDPHWRIQANFTTSTKAGQNASREVKRKAFIEYNEQLIRAADQVIIAWNGNEHDVAMTAAAYAARRGKLLSIIDQNGQELDIVETSKLAMSVNLSKREFARARNAGAFDIPASSPEGRLGLSLVKGLPAPAINPLSQTPYTINQIIDMAKSPEGKKTLLQQHKVSGVAIRALSDDRAVSNARENLQRILQHCETHGVSIVGPEAFPDKMIASGIGTLPPVLFVQAKDPAALRDVKNVAAIFGDENLLPHIAKQATDLATSMDRPGTMLLQIEDQGMPKFAPENPSVLLLTCGHAHCNRSHALTWKPNETNRGITANGSTGRYDIAASADGKSAELTLTDKASQQRTVVKSIPFSAFLKKGDKEPTRQELNAAKAAAGRMLRQTASETEKKIVMEPVKRFRDSIIERGGFVVSHLPPVETSSVWSAADAQRIGFDSTRSDETRAKAAELATRTADVVVITQLESRSPIRKAVPAAVDNNRRLIVINPPREVRNLPEVEGNITLLTEEARNVPFHLGLSGNDASAITRKISEGRVAINSGQHMEIAAEKLASLMAGDANATRTGKASVKSREKADLEQR